MGIFFNEDWELAFPVSLNEFEADGEKYTNDDEDDEYKVDDTEENQDNADGEEDEGTQEDDDPAPEDGEEPATDDGADEYTLDDTGDDDGEGTEPATDDGTDNADDQPEDTTTGDDEYTLDDTEEDQDNADDGDEGTGEGEDTPEDGEEPATDDEGTDTGDDEYSLDDDEGTTDDGDPAEDGESDTDSNLKQLEGELFDQLTPEQKIIKINELKKCFQELHERCDNLIQLLNDVSAPDENSSKVFEYLNDNLIDLKQYIYDYFTYTFETKSYIENSAQYQKYIALLNSLNSVLEELKKSKQE